MDLFKETINIKSFKFGAIIIFTEFYTFVQVLLTFVNISRSGQLRRHISDFFLSIFVCFSSAYVWILNENKQNYELGEKKSEYRVLPFSTRSNLRCGNLEETEIILFCEGSRDFSVTHVYTLY